MYCEKELQESCANVGIECSHCMFNSDATTEDFYEGELNSEDYEIMS